MIAYIKGIVKQINLDIIIVENSGVGYNIFFNRPEKLSLQDEVLIYIFQRLSEDEISLFGFLSLEELTFFKKLISVKGIGPKSAMNIMANVNLPSLINAIEHNDQGYLRSINGIGPKSAAQIILDLKGKLDFINEEKKNNIFVNLEQSLQSLGYKSAEITKITKELKEYENESEEFVLKKALQMLASRRG